MYMNCMAQLNISVPEGLKKWADQRVAEGRYSSTSDLVRDLMRRRQEEEERLSALQAAIDKGRASPPDPRSVAEIFADVRREYHERNG
jgi:antitoxin ParD1/3/4